MASSKKKEKRMPRERKGTVSKRKDGSWWARLIYFDDYGKRHDLRRKAATKAEANDIREDLLEQYDRGGSRLFEAENKTFADLCDFEEHYLIEPVYHEGRKIAGLRSFTSQKMAPGNVERALRTKAAALVDPRESPSLSCE